MSAIQQVISTNPASSGNSNYDPYYSNVSLLLSMNGFDLGNTFVDLSYNTKTITNSSGLVLTRTDNFKFGGAAAAFPGSAASYLTVSSSPDFAFGTGDFTVECWIYNVGPTSNSSIVASTSINGAGSFGLFFEAGTGLIVRIDGTGNDLTYNYTEFQQWNHIAVVRRSGVMTLYINGTSVASGDRSTRAVTQTQIDIGILGGFGYGLSARLDDLRITKGIARYTANFTPPAFANPRIGPSYDPFYNNVSLLLGMNGSNGSTYFPDTSSSPKTVNTLGSPQITTSVVKYGTGSLYLNGSISQLRVPTNTNFNFGTADFTIEGWYYLLDTTSIRCLWDFNECQPFRIMFESSTLKLQYSSAGTTVISTTDITWTTWNHIALVRSGNVVTLYVNGNSKGTWNTTLNLSPGSVNLFIGCNRGDTWFWNGYIDDFRITNDVARYTANFTPPTAPFANTGPTVDPYYDYVTLLLPMNGANSSTSFIDSSRTAKVITVNDGAQISTTRSKFGGSSAYFDGANDYLSVASSEDFNFGSLNFTIELWVNRVGLGTGDRFLVSRNNGSDFLFRWEAANILQFYINSNLILSNSFAFDVDTWYHFAVVRSGNNFILFVNGVSVATATTSITMNNSGQPVLVGGYTAGDYFNGYIDDLRITKGIARYTANFTVPAQPNPVTGVQYDNYYDNVSLLLSMNGPNSGTSFLDSSPRSKTVTANLNAVTSTAQYKWGVSSAYFDGSGDYLSVPASTDFSFGTSNFTIELWVYFTSVAANKQLLGASSTTVTFYSGSAGNLNYFLSSNGTSWDIVNNALMSAVTTNTWYHVALVRNGNVFTPYVNGVAGTPTTSSSPIYSSPVPLYIGGSSTDSTTTIGGYVDDVRITKGIARYTANFTPPTQAFPSQGPNTDPFYYNTSLLLHMNGTNGSTVFTDASPNPKNVVPSGNAQISTAQFKWGGSSAIFDGTDDFLTVSTAAAYDWLTNSLTSWTIECWFNVPNVSGTKCIVSKGTNNSTMAAIICNVSSNTVFASWYKSSAFGAVSSTTTDTFTANTWNHFAVVYDAVARQMRLFLNGVAGTTATLEAASNYSIANNQQLKIGTYSDGFFDFSTYIDDFRITQGVVRYRNNFTPPQRPFPDQ